MSVKNLNFYERPYEKLERYGAESLSDAEILAILINSGTKTKTALDIARELTTKDENNIGLSFLAQYSIEELMKIQGIGRVKAILIKAVCEFAERYTIPELNPNEKICTPEQLSKIFMKDLHGKKQEIIKTVLLNSKNKVIRVVTNSIGTVNSNSITIKEILSEPVKSNTPKIAVAHNHPSRRLYSK